MPSGFPFVEQLLKERLKSRLFVDWLQLAYPDATPKPDKSVPVTWARMTHLEVEIYTSRPHATYSTTKISAPPGMIHCTWGSSHPASLCCQSTRRLGRD